MRGDRLDELPDVLTVAEVARVMRLSPNSVYALIHSGELPAVRAGGTFRITRQALREYLGLAGDG